MCEVATEDKYLLLFIGTDRSRRKNLSLQLYDIDSNDWYEPHTFSEDKYKSARPNTVMGIIGSEMYFFVDRKPKDDGKTERKGQKIYYSFDFVPKVVTKIGILPATAISRSAFVVVENCIYSVSGSNVACFDTIAKSIKNKLGKINMETTLTVYDHSAVHYNGSIFCVGPNGTFRSFNINTHETKELSKSPFVDGCQSIALFNNKFYVVEICTLKRTAIYTPETDGWEVFPTKGPNVDGGKLIVCNERLLCATERCNIYEYDFDSKKWVLLIRGPVKGIIRYKGNCTVGIVKKCYPELWYLMRSDQLTSCEII